jgi:hypothetical protein
MDVEPLYRRRALAGEPEPERLPFWQSNEHELDFVPSPNEYVEVGSPSKTFCIRRTPLDIPPHSLAPPPPYHRSPPGRTAARSPRPAVREAGG